jgi:cbb3-type cytochrome oxidase subunit 1
MALRIMGGALLVTSFGMFAYNVIATVVVKRPKDVPRLPLAASVAAPASELPPSEGGVTPR